MCIALAEGWHQGLHSFDAPEFSSAAITALSPAPGPSAAKLPRDSNLWRAGWQPELA
jgi:hypothetical protein